MEIEPESLRSPVYHQLKFAFTACLWVPRMIYLLVLDIVTEVPVTVYEIILLLWEFSAYLVAHFRLLVMTSEKQPVSKNLHRSRQMMMQHADLLGMDDYKCKVHKFLESESPHDSVLGLWGTSGVGKTRLLMLIGLCYGDADSPFHYIIALKDGDVREMQDNVAAFLNLNLDWNTMSSSQEHVRANIISEHLNHYNFILLLDDVQHGDLDLASIGLPMPLGRRQKVILTSKSQAVCGRMGCAEANTVEMKCLGEEDAWNLFKYKAGVEITEANAEIHRIAKLMVSSCGGLPRSISSIAKAVAGMTCCGMDPDDWFIVYECFKANKWPRYCGLGDSEDHVSNLQNVSSSRQGSAGPSKRGKSAVPRTSAGPRRGLRSDKEGYVEMALPNAPSRRKVVSKVPLAPTHGGAADSGDAEDRC
uniref:Uncharacterized protein n=1 Tax=Avena sativa TaxID=4498 RepID=A0ACD6A502_AVESA